MTTDTTKAGGAHTPGPWRMKGPSKPTRLDPEPGDYAILDSNHDIIAEAFLCVSDYRRAPAEANARLIAAAPRQHDALLAVRCAPGFDSLDEATKNAVIGAIAAATGEQQ